MQQAPQPEHVDADEVGRLRGRCVPPDLVKERVGGDDLARVDQQGRQDRTPLRRADPPPGFFSGSDLKRSEQPEPHHQLRLGGPASLSGDGTAAPPAISARATWVPANPAPRISEIAVTGS